MKVTIDGASYDVDMDWLLERYAAKTRALLDPASGDALLHDTERLALKALLRPRQNKLLKLFAQALCIEDWETLKPQKGDDILLLLHGYIMLLLRAELANISVDIATEPTEPEGGNHVALLEGDAPTRARVTSAALGPLALTSGSADGDRDRAARTLTERAPAALTAPGGA